MEVNSVNKDKLVEALQKVMNLDGAEELKDELETVMAIIIGASDDEIKSAWEDYQSDK